MLSPYKLFLIQLFFELQKLQKAPVEKSGACLLIQDILVKNIKKFEIGIQSTSRMIARRNKSLKMKRAIPIGKARAAGLKEAIEKLYKLREHYRYVIYILRAVGDGLAFIYFQPGELAPMATKQKSGFISGKKGLAVEIKALKRVFRSGGIGILTDLTNCLRHGDIIVYKDRRRRVIEVKTSGLVDKRGERQNERLNKLVELLNSGQADDFDRAGFRSVRIISHSPELHYLDEMNSLIAKANKKGIAFSEVEDGLYYLAISGSRNIEERVERAFTMLNNLEPDRHLFWLDRTLVNDLPFYPLTLSIENAKALYDFYNGALFLFVAVSRQKIRAKFAPFGVNVEFEPKDKRTFLEIQRTDTYQGSWPLPLPIGYGFLKIAYEFLSLDWYLEETIYVLNNANNLPIASQENIVKSQRERVKQS